MNEQLVALVAAGLANQQKQKPRKPRCDSPPKGWRCNDDKGHEGPCAAWPDTLWLKLKWAWRMKSLSVLAGRHL